MLAVSKQVNMKLNQRTFEHRTFILSTPLGLGGITVKADILRHSLNIPLPIIYIILYIGTQKRIMEIIQLLKLDQAEFVPHQANVVAIIIGIIFSSLFIFSGLFPFLPEEG